MDPDPDPDPALQVNSDPIRIQHFDGQKLERKNTAENLFKFIFDQKMSKLQEKLSALKRKLLMFVVLFSLLDPGQIRTRSTGFHILELDTILNLRYLCSDESLI